jgi:hypothetical protein
MDRLTVVLDESLSLAGRTGQAGATEGGYAAMDGAAT